MERSGDQGNEADERSLDDKLKAQLKTQEQGLQHILWMIVDESGKSSTAIGTLIANVKAFRAEKMNSSKGRAIKKQSGEVATAGKETLLEKGSVKAEIVYTGSPQKGIIKNDVNFEDKELDKELRQADQGLSNWLNNESALAQVWLSFMPKDFAPEKEQKDKESIWIAAMVQIPWTLVIEGAKVDVKIGGKRICGGVRGASGSTQREVVSLTVSEDGASTLFYSKRAGAIGILEKEAARQGSGFSVQPTQAYIEKEEAQLDQLKGYVQPQVRSKPNETLAATLDAVVTSAEYGYDKKDNLPNERYKAEVLEVLRKIESPATMDKASRIEKAREIVEALAGNQRWHAMRTFKRASEFNMEVLKQLPQSIRHEVIGLLAEGSVPQAVAARRKEIADTIDKMIEKANSKQKPGWAAEWGDRRKVKEIFTAYNVEQANRGQT